MCDRSGIVVNWTDEKREKRLFPDPEKVGEHEANKRLDESDTDRPDTRDTHTPADRHNDDSMIRKIMIKILKLRKFIEIPEFGWRPSRLKLC